MSTSGGSAPPQIVGSDDLGLVVDALNAGSVVALPTDTVYGLAARVDRPDAIASIFSLKGRSENVALPVLIGRWRQLDHLVAEWPHDASMLAARFWPGPLTLVVPALPAIGQALGGSGSTVGVRRPGHRLIRELCRICGPLAVTSANLHGDEPCTSAAEVESIFRSSSAADRLAVILDDGLCDGAASTVVDCTTSPPTCLRQGAIAWDWIQAALR